MMYQVVHGEQLSNSFKVKIGVRQRCVFSLFYSSFLETYDNKRKEIHCMKLRNLMILTSQMAWLCFPCSNQQVKIEKLLVAVILRLKSNSASISTRQRFLKPVQWGPSFPAWKQTEGTLSLYIPLVTLASWGTGAYVSEIDKAKAVHRQLKNYGAPKSLLITAKNICFSTPTQSQSCYNIKFGQEPNWQPENYNTSSTAAWEESSMQICWPYIHCQLPRPLMKNQTDAKSIDMMKNRRWR